MHEDSAETQLLLKAAAHGDRQAFERLFARHQPAVREFVRKRFDPRLRTRLDASDIVQDTQAEAFRRLDDYLARQPMPFRAWVLKTAFERLQKTRRYHIAAARRSVRREVSLPDRSSLALARQFLVADHRGPNPGDRELAERVRRALARLSATDREVILMRDLEGLSNREIGYLLDLEAATVSKRHGRALLRLHKVLTQLDQAESAT